VLHPLVEQVILTADKFSGTNEWMSYWKYQIEIVRYWCNKSIALAAGYQVVITEYKGL